MINKYRGRMVQRDYIMGNIFHKNREKRKKKDREERGKERLRKGIVATRVAFVLCLLNLY